MNVESVISVIKKDSMEETTVETQNSKIKKQNSKTYYITFTEQFKYFNRGFLQGWKNNNNFGKNNIMKNHSNL